MMPAVVLLSGGMDSAVMLASAAPGSIALFIHWGQPAAGPEMAAAGALAARFGHRYRMVDSHLGWRAMMTGPGVPGPRLVGGRNLLFVSLAVAVACEARLHEVWLGASLADRYDYLDCGPDFVTVLGSLTFATYGVVLRAPLIDMPRDRVRDEVVRLQLETWSCYDPIIPLEGGFRPCGGCNGCARSR